ncbi:MAG TPA: HU family DNA-binding protein [Nitrospinota bacterium]|jgi:DNA-binding protein HU-beta|nr:HU family DNA-binding protein [Nitrospinota bacterium]|tara:strand:- start:476 stop:751 length:276 start_codon:yes stop_codon:yes gene_type:complete
MTKAELVTAVQKGCGCDLSKRAIESLINCTFENIAKAVRKDKRFSYPEFGTFTVRKRKARTGRNPQTGAKLNIKASKSVGFKPAPSLKSSL